jgi:hypothetical protein
MKVYLTTRLCIAFTCLFFFFLIKAWPQTSSSPSLLQKPFDEKGLFDADDVLQITLTGNMRNLLNDRTDVPKNNSMVLSYKKEDSPVLLFFNQSMAANQFFPFFITKTI